MGNPGSRDDAVLILLRIFPLTFTLGAGDGIVRNVGDSHSAISSPRGESVRLSRG